MKKFFVLAAAAVAFNATVANAIPLLDDSASFTVARAVKLGTATVITVLRRQSAQKKRPI